MVLDEEGKFVHPPVYQVMKGGANEWGAQVAKSLGAQLVIDDSETLPEPYLYLGMGCERNCPLEFLEAFMLDALCAKRLTAKRHSFLKQHRHQSARPTSLPSLQNMIGTQHLQRPTTRPNEFTS